MPLTEKRKAFVREYAIDHNATKAAERAGFSKATAYSQGSRLLKDVEVRAELEKMFKQAAASAEEVIALVAAQARGESPTKTRIVRDHEGNETVTEEYDRHSPADKLLRVHAKYDAGEHVVGKLLIVRSADEVFEGEE